MPSRVYNAVATRPRASKRRRTKEGPTRYIMSKTFSSSRSFPSPPKARMTLRYWTDKFDVTGAAAGIAGSHVFSANGCYDPDITGTGHQPIGFDQYMAIYDHYTVIGAKMKLFCQNQLSSAPQYIGIRLNDAASPSSNPLEIVENGNVELKLLSVAGTSATQNLGTLSLSCNVAKFLGRGQLLSDSQCKGTASANPAEQVYFQVFAFTNDGSTGGIVKCSAMIEFDVVFHERTILGTS